MLLESYVSKPSEFSNLIKFSINSVFHYVILTLTLSIANIFSLLHGQNQNNCLSHCQQKSYFKRIILSSNSLIRHKKQHDCNLPLRYTPAWLKGRSCHDCILHCVEFEVRLASILYSTYIEKINKNFKKRRRRGGKRK